MQEGRVLVRVQQVQRLVAVEPLFRVDGIERQVQRPLVPLADPHVGREPAEVDADARIGLAVHGQRGRDIHVGAPEVGELGLPVLLLEVEEERAQDGRLVERLAGERLHVGRLDAGAGLRRGLLLAAARPAPSGRSEAAATPPPGTALLLGGLAGRLALVRVQVAVAVLVELLEQLGLLAHRPSRSEPGGRSHPTVHGVRQGVGVERAFLRRVRLADESPGGLRRLPGREAAVLIGIGRREDLRRQERAGSEASRRAIRPARATGGRTPGPPGPNPGGAAATATRGRAAGAIGTRGRAHPSVHGPAEPFGVDRALLVGVRLADELLGEPGRLLGREATVLVRVGLLDDSRGQEGAGAEASGTRDLRDRRTSGPRPWARHLSRQVCRPPASSPRRRSRGVRPRRRPP